MRLAANKLVFWTVVRLSGVLLLVTAITGCSSSGANVDSAAAPQRVKYLRVEPDANLSRYTTLMPGGLEVLYPQRAEQPYPEDLQYIRDTFRRAFLGAIADDYPVTTQAGPGVMRVRAQVIETNLNGLVRETGPANALPRGELLLIMEMHDSVTGKLLARASDGSANVAFDAELTGAPLVDAAAGYWAGLFRQWLDQSGSMAAAGD